MGKLPTIVDQLDRFKMAEGVKDAERLMQEGLQLKETMMGMIAQTEMSIDSFVSELQEQQPEGSIEISPTTRGHITMLAILTGMLAELKGKIEEFDQFWFLHKERMDHMMRMCHFKRTAEKVS